MTLSFSTFAYDERDLASMCFRKGAKDNYEMIKNFMDSQEQEESCHFKLSEDKNTATYECRYSKSEYSNCTTKSPRLSLLSFPKIYQKHEASIKECFEKVGVNALNIKGSHCFFGGSISEKTAVYICDEHVSEVQDCDSKPKLTALKIDVRKYTGFLPARKFSEGDINIAQKCAKTLNISFDLTPFPSLCTAQKVNEENDETVNTTRSQQKVETKDYGYSDYMKNRYLSPGSLEAIYQKSFGDSSSYQIAKAGHGVQGSGGISVLGEMIDSIKNKLFPPTVSFLVTCPNLKQVFIPKCDLEKINQDSRKINVDAINNTSRKAKPSSNVDSSPLPSNTNEGATISK